ncbi:MAG: hypothetical protein MH252_22460 [Thermosynechococcaceae cyanobacterium MS004]|nr:hypothetical protein [Thermosynechococcaceae cyanobacterium MS004]
MARYTHDLIVAVPLSHFYEQVKDVLKSCDLEVIYFKEDYLIAREAPGNVPFAKLVTIEILVDSTRAKAEATHFSVVVKNEELPLQTDNHCFQIYQKINKAIAENKGWSLLRSVTTNAADSTPQVKAPEVKASEVTASEVTASEVKAPGTNASN